ncbi:MAG: hypothetical protein IKO30_04555 [Lachnospiraceae bacterium]|nr:hypothetical protein [Lachnospiraceae bacterium]
MTIQENMNKYMQEKIEPYIGLESFKFGDTLSEVRNKLKSDKIAFSQSVDPHKGCQPEVAWTFIEINKSITLCFALDVLFEIVLEGQYVGSTPEGFFVGMPFQKLLELDKTLEYNEDDEDYISEKGYWFEENIETGKVASITVFIPEANDNNEFFGYNWVSKYRRSTI